MQKLAIAVAISAFLSIPAVALAANDSAKMNNQNTQSVRQQVENNLRQAGFSDIKIIPSLFS